MSARFPCPACGGDAINVAADYDPFEPNTGALGNSEVMRAVELKCANGHVWIESQNYARSGDDSVQSGPRRRDLCHKVD